VEKKIATRRAGKREEETKTSRSTTDGGKRYISILIMKSRGALDGRREGEARGVGRGDKVALTASRSP